MHPLNFDPRKSMEVLMLPQWEVLDNVRREAGYLTPSEVMERIGRFNRVLDPFSVLISPGISVGTGNTFYPNVVITAPNAALMFLGSDNVFHGSTLIEATGGSVYIGDGNLFGEGGTTIRANDADTTISIGNDCRFIHGAAIYGTTQIGTGAQILGRITVISCQLASGGRFDDPNVDQRAAVLKGMGVARNITLARGEVIAGWGDFDPSLAQPQSNFH